MVSFSCEGCGDVLTKKKLDPHRNSCRGAHFSCLDCLTTFKGLDYRTHTTCITEAQKYQGKLYKEPKKNTNNKQNQSQPQPQPQPRSQSQPQSQPTKPAAGSSTPSQALVPKEPKMASIAIEADSRVAIVDVIPRAPSPPPAFNVFDFLVQNGEESTHPLESDESSDSSSDVSSSSEDESDSDSDSMDTDEPDPMEDSAAAAREYMKQELLNQSYSYGAEGAPFVRFQTTQFPPSPAGQSGQFETPAPTRGHHRNISTTSADSTTKESTKKRKRGHPEELDLSSAHAYKTADIVMTDVPAPLHSGLTGGLNRLLSRPELPPSPPDLDGSPQSPLKRSKRTKEEKKSKEKDKDKAKKEKTTKSKDKKEKEKKSSTTTVSVKDAKNGQWVRRRVRKDSSTNAGAEPSSDHEQPARKQIKAIDFKPDGGADDRVKSTPQNAMIVHSKQSLSRAELFLSTAIKGTDDESRGCSLSKALKRYHKQRSASSAKKSAVEEKDLWKVLRVRKNIRGEMVLFIEE